MELISLIFSGIKGFIELVIKLFDWRKNRHDSARKKARTHDAETILSRFLSIFELRQIPRALIPRALKAQHLLSVSEACSDELLSKRLSDELIVHTANRMAVNSAWLYGVETTPNTRHFNYKHPPGVLELLTNLLAANTKLEAGDEELVVVANMNCYDGIPPNTRMVILLNTALDELEGIAVNQVQVIEDDLPWDHAPARIHVKQVVLLAMLLGISIRGMSVSAQHFERFEEGATEAYGLLLNRKSMWHPDDYAVRVEKSPVAKESDEALKIYTTLAANGLIDEATRKREALGRQGFYDWLLTYPRVDPDRLN